MPMSRAFESYGQKIEIEATANLRNVQTKRRSSAKVFSLNDDSEDDDENIDCTKTVTKSTKSYKSKSDRSDESDSETETNIRPTRTVRPSNTVVAVRSIVRPMNVTAGSGRPPKIFSGKNIKIPTSRSNVVHDPYPIKSNVRIVAYPEYQFYENEYTPDLYADITIDSPITCFPKSSDLVSLADIVRSDPEVLGGDCIKMNHTAIGEHLRELTWRRSDCAQTKKIMNDTRAYPLVYYLVYGAVPRKMIDASTYFMKQLVQSYFMFGQSKDLSKYVPMVSGEIELMTMIYWNISCDDLRDWKDDSPRKTLKRLLAYAWSLLPKETTEHGEYVKQKILDYAEFDVHDKISAHCLLHLKYYYSEIIGMCSKEAVTVWHYFMKSCKIHHYLCPHTIRAIYTHMPVVADTIKAKFEIAKCENSNISARIVSRSEAAKLYKPKWLKTDSHMNASLYENTNNLITWILRRVAVNIISLGLHVDMSEITERTIAGIASTFKDLPSSNVFVNRAFSNTVIRNIIGRFVKSVQVEANDIVKLKISRAGKESLIELVYITLSRAISAVAFTDDDPGVKWADALATAISDYMDDVSTGTDMSSWYVGNDDTEAKPDDFSESDDSDVEYESDNSEFDSADISSERRKRFAEVDEKFDSFTRIIDNIPVKKSRRMLCKDACLGGRYQFDPTKISRTRCTLCHVDTTVNLLCLDTNLQVPTCNFCARTLNDNDYDLKTLRARIRNRVKAPLMFKILEDNTRELLTESDISSGLTQLSYNYVERREQIKMYDARKLEKSKRRSEKSAAPAERVKKSRVK